MLRNVCIFLIETPVLGGDCLDDLLEVFQHFTPSCTSTSGTTTSFYDDSLLSKTSEKCPSTPQLDIDLLDEFVLRELESISAELSDYNSTRRGQKVKKRLFSCSSDEEPTPKKRRVSSSSDSESDDDLQLAWTSARRS